MLKKPALFFICFLLANALLAQNSSFKALKVGDTIPVFSSLKNASKAGKDFVSLSDNNDKKGLIIVFMTNNCYHCINYRERIKELHTMYAPKGFPLISINPYNNTYAAEDTFEEMQKNAKKENYDFPYLQTDNETLPAKFGLKTTPTVYIAQNVNHHWILKYVGSIDDDMNNKKIKKNNFVQNAMQQILNNK